MRTYKFTNLLLRLIDNVQARENKHADTIEGVCGNLKNCVSCFRVGKWEGNVSDKLVYIKGLQKENGSRRDVEAAFYWMFFYYGTCSHTHSMIMNSLSLSFLLTAIPSQCVNYWSRENYTNFLTHNSPSLIKILLRRLFPKKKKKLKNIHEQRKFLW